MQINFIRTESGPPGQYKFNVGSQSVIGNLGWNANGSLGSLDITDPFNSSNTQNCSFSADDLSRIATANCGAIWGQSFSYDPFGNISKQVLSGSVGTTFQPTYATSPSITNQIATLPGNVHPTYDANGNSLNDSFNTYTWDADNNSISAANGSATVSLTYDAFDRMVEQARGTAYTQIVYSPLGSKLAKMNGATLQTAYVPLTSGASAIYTSSGLAYYRHPDHLGSSRFASTSTQTMYSDTAYSAFGEPYAQSGTADVSFTGQDQDTVPGVSDFLYRKYSPAQGRWTSPDPVGLAAVDPTNPQSWNRYAYVLNSPLLFTDPLGLCGGGDGDPGGACQDFSYYDASGCLVSVTYFKKTLAQPDGPHTYDIPVISISCSGGGGGGNTSGTISAGSLDILNDYCSARGRAKFVADWVPGGQTLVRNFWGNSSLGEKLGFFQLSTADINRITEEGSGGQTVAIHTASEALKGAAASGVFLGRLRSATGIPKTLASNWLGRAAVALLVADVSYAFYKEGKEILDCHAGN